MRRESCDSPSSPEPSAGLYGRGEFGERRAGAQRSLGRVGRGGLTQRREGLVGRGGKTGRRDDGTVGRQAKGGLFSVEWGRGGGFRVKVLIP